MSGDINWREIDRETEQHERLSASPAAKGEGPACQLCGGRIEAWICQTCEADFEEVNGQTILKSQAQPPAPDLAKDAVERADDLWPVGSWLSAALDDPNVCEAMKADIREWFDKGGCYRSDAGLLAKPMGREELARIIDSGAFGLPPAVRARPRLPEPVTHSQADEYNRQRALDLADAILSRTGEAG